LGRDEPAVSAVRPLALKARIALRTVWRAQHKPAAIARGGCPDALNSTIWARRTVNALLARRLASRWARSASRSSRTKIGGCISVRCGPSPFRTRPLLRMH
jgi:hypothetical protein